MPARALHVLVGVGLILAAARAADKPAPPLRQAHAHNDYDHQRPLLDALDHGFCSVEADVFLTDGKLLVAHDRKDLKHDRTLESLYLARSASGRGRTAAGCTPAARPSTC